MQLIFHSLHYYILVYEIMMLITCLQASLITNLSYAQQVDLILAEGKAVIANNITCNNNTNNNNNASQFWDICKAFYKKYKIVSSIYILVLLFIYFVIIFIIIINISIKYAHIIKLILI